MPIGRQTGLAAILSLALVMSAVAGEPEDVVNPSIDMAAYLAVAAAAAAHRESHRVSEQEFLRLSREPGRSFSMREAAKNMTSCTSSVHST